MVKKARNAEATTPAPTRRRRPVLAALITVGLVSALVFAVWRLGDDARRNIGPRERYEVNFSEILCDSPPGITRERFVDEVRYISGIPPKIQLLDSELSTKLTAAFSAHPWVEQVQGISIDPPATLTVKLTFRTPVLSIPAHDGRRALDAKGILLPAFAATENLPEFIGMKEISATARSGQPCPNELAVRAASVAAEYRPKTIEHVTQGWQLVMPDGKKLIVGR